MFTRMAFRQQSQDLNPSEHLWERLRRKNIQTSQDSLWDALQESWNVGVRILKENSIAVAEEKSD